MQRTFSSLFISSLVIWIGAALFFSLVVLPTLFMNLERANAGTVAALLFPAYFRLGAAAGGVLLATTLLIARHAGSSGRTWKLASGVVAAMLTCQLYATFVVHPEIDSIRGIESSQSRFDTLHKRSVRLNGVILLGGVGLVVCSGWLFDRR
jgi:hypothetical protein